MSPELDAARRTERALFELSPREPLAPLVAPRSDPEHARRASLVEILLIVALVAAVILELAWILAQYPPVTVP